MNRRDVLVGVASMPLVASMTMEGFGMSGFTRLVANSLPPDLELPTAFASTFDWLEANNFVRRGDTAFLKPSDAQLTSELSFKPVDAGHVAAWLGTDDPGYVDRLAPIIQTGGDGSYAALWRQDDGRTSLVHMGSGSGSTLMCVLTNDPVDMLRLMAIGYAELCWPENFGITPEMERAALAAAIGPENVPPYSPPTQFRQFVSKTFGVTIPQRASEIITTTALMDSVGSDDPFWQWMQTVPRA